MHIEVIILTTLPYRWPFGPTHSLSQWLTENEAFSNQRPAFVKVRCFIAWKIFFTEYKRLTTENIFHRMQGWWRMHLMSFSFLRIASLCPMAFWLILLVFWGNVFFRMRENMAIFFNPLSLFPFCVFVMIPRRVMAFPTQRCCSQLALLHCAAGLSLNLYSYKHG